MFIKSEKCCACRGMTRREKSEEETADWRLTHSCSHSHSERLNEFIFLHRLSAKSREKRENETNQLKLSVHINEAIKWATLSVLSESGHER